MYIGLRTSDTLHKKPRRIGPGLCVTSEKAPKAKFAERPECEVLVHSPFPRRRRELDGGSPHVNITVVRAQASFEMGPIKLRWHKAIGSEARAMRG